MAGFEAIKHWGSDVAVALGLSKYKSPYMLWLDKTGRFKFESTNPVTEFGIRWEPFAREHFQKVTGLDVTVDNMMYYHSDYPMLSANIDGRFISNDGDGILEIKTTTSNRVPILADLEDVPVE